MEEPAMSRRQRTRRQDIDARARWLARRRNRPKLHWAVALQVRDADGSQRKEIVPLPPLTVTQARSIIQSIDADLEAGCHPTIEVDGEEIPSRSASEWIDEIRAFVANAERDDA